MRTRTLLLSILVAALVALATLSRLREVHRSGFERTPGIITAVVLILAVTGHPFAWGLAFALAALGTGFQTAYALSDLDEPARLAVAAVGLVVVLALWGLRPQEEPAPPPRTQG
jgi:hypothetical protein